MFGVCIVNGLLLVQTDGAIRQLRGDLIESPRLPGFSASVNTLLAKP